jgi:hypothetical protein
VGSAQASSTFSALKSLPSTGLPSAFF